MALISLEINVVGVKCVYNTNLKIYIALIDTLSPFLVQFIKYLCFVMYFYNILLDKNVKLTACVPYIYVPKF